MATKVKADGEVIYSVRIKGEFLYLDGRHRKSDNYDVTVEMTQAMVDAGPLSSFKNHIAKQLFPKHFPGFKRIRLMEVVEASRSDGEGIDNLYLMSYVDMCEYIKLSGYPINSILFDNPGKLREAIKLFKEDPESFVVFQDRQEALHGSTAKSRLDAEKLLGNAVFNDPDEPVNPAKVRPSKKAEGKIAKGKGAGKAATPASLKAEGKSKELPKAEFHTPDPANKI